MTQEDVGVNFKALATNTLQQYLQQNTNFLHGLLKLSAKCMNDKVNNPLKGVTNKSWFFEQQVYDINGIIRALKSTEGSGNVPKIIVYD